LKIKVSVYQFRQTKTKLRQAKNQKPKSNHVPTITCHTASAPF